MIICGSYHNIILNENNELYVCGRNDSGQLGLGNFENRNVYTKLEHNFGKIKNISCGSNYNIILTENNELFVCGNNYHGQLGLGDYNNRYTYTKLENNFGKIKNIYCGNCHNIILNENNELYVCGYSYFGQLGLGDYNNRNTYTKLEHNFGKIKNIYCGDYHNIILNEYDELYVCGNNCGGQLGLGDNKDRNTYAKLKHNFGKIQNIFCGGFHSIILNENNELYVCGFNDCGQLGLDDNNNINTYIELKHNFGKIKNIYCEANNSFILNENNQIFVCGDNYYGQLGLGHNINSNTYKKLEHNFRKIIYIYSGNSHSIILNVNDELYVCGDNEFYQLGLGDNNDRNVYTKLDLHFDIFNKKPIEHILELNLSEIII
jgi:alpha-tubulin suppressor-like RCC1 family protein